MWRPTLRLNRNARGSVDQAGRTRWGATQKDRGRRDKRMTKHSAQLQLFMRGRVADDDAECFAL
eukprot:6158142-Pyramimonas_sp.AAC.1